MIARDGRIVWFKDEARLVRRDDGDTRVLAGRDDRHHRRKRSRGTARRGRGALPRAGRADAQRHLHRRRSAGATGVLYISPQIEAMLGYTPQDWYADPGLWGRLVHPDDADRSTPGALGRRARASGTA